MYDPDAHRYDSWLGNPPMMRPMTNPCVEFTWAAIEPLRDIGWRIHTGDSETCLHAIGKPRYCSVCR